MLDERRKFSTQKVRLMPLKLRQTGLGSGIDKDPPKSPQRLLAGAPGFHLTGALLRTKGEQATPARVGEPGPGSSSLFVYLGLREAPLGPCRRAGFPFGVGQ
jgi:hypothetical protein